jgi:hypothetical protein
MKFLSQSLLLEGNSPNFSIQLSHVSFIYKKENDDYCKIFFTYQSYHLIMCLYIYCQGVSIFCNNFFQVKQMRKQLIKHFNSSFKKYIKIINYLRLTTTVDFP